VEIDVIARTIRYLTGFMVVAISPELIRSAQMQESSTFFAAIHVYCFFRHAAAPAEPYETEGLRHASVSMAGKKP